MIKQGQNYLDTIQDIMKQQENSSGPPTVNKKSSTKEVLKEC